MPAVAYGERLPAPATAAVPTKETEPMTSSDRRGVSRHSSYRELAAATPPSVRRLIIALVLAGLAGVSAIACAVAATPRASVWAPAMVPGW
jgi:hypothetical protein